MNGYIVSKLLGVSLGKPSYSRGLSYKDGNPKSCFLEENSGVLSCPNWCYSAVAPRARLLCRIPPTATPESVSLDWIAGIFKFSRPTQLTLIWTLLLKSLPKEDIPSRGIHWGNARNHIHASPIKRKVAISMWAAL